MLASAGRRSGDRALSLLLLPSLQSQKNGAWYFLFTTYVVGDGASGQAQRFGSCGQAQTVLPTPADELGGVRVAILLERHLPKPIGTHVNIAGPHDTAAVFSNSCAREHRLSAQRTQPLQSMDRLLQVHRHFLVVCPAHNKFQARARVLHVRDSDCVSLAHDSSSEYCCQR